MSKTSYKCKFIELPDIKEYINQGYGIYFGLVEDKDDIVVVLRRGNDSLIYNMKEHKWMPVKCNISGEYIGNSRVN